MKHSSRNIVFGAAFLKNGPGPLIPGKKKMNDTGKVEEEAKQTPEPSDVVEDYAKAPRLLTE